MTRIKDDVTTFLISFLFLKPNFASGLDRIVDLAIIAFLFLIQILNKLLFPQNKILKLNVIWMSIIFVMMSVTYALNALATVPYATKDLYEFYRPVFNILLLITGYHLSSNYKKIFLYSVYVVIFFQLIMMLMQYQNIGNINSSIISKFYNMDKASIKAKRTVGTYANPNALGFIINLIGFYIFLYKKDKKYLYKIIFFSLHILMIILSSSRTSLVSALFIYSILFFKSFATEKTIKKQVTLIIVILFITLLIFINFDKVLTLLAIFKYVYSTITDFQNGGWQAIRGIAVRLNYYQQMLIVIKENLLLGIGPLKSVFDVGDNDYLFTTLQWGIIGAIIKYGFYLWNLKLQYKYYKKTGDWFCGGNVISILLLFIYGLTVESFYNYKYLSIILINCSYCYSFFIDQKEETHYTYSHSSA